MILFRTRPFALHSIALAIALAACASTEGTTRAPTSAAAPPDEGDRMLDVGGQKLSVHIRGHGPPCLAEPGGPGVEWTYLRMPAVEQFLTMVYVEPLGTGGSSHVDKALLTRRRYADDLEGIRASLGLERIYLLGHSYGGTAVQLYAVAHGDRLLGVILYDTTPRLDDQFGKAVQAGLDSFKGEPWYADAVAAWGEEDKVETDEQTTQIVRREMPTLFGEWTRRKAELEPMVATMRAYAAPLRGSQIDAEPFDMRSALRGVDAPALIIVGQLDRITSLPFAEEMRAALPHARLVVLEHSGHLGHIEEPEAFAQAVRAFVQKQ